MGEKKPQTYANHRRLIPLYHGFVFGVLALHFLRAGYRLVTAPSLDGGLDVLVAAALVLLFFFARIFAIKAQDRIIRLEMQLRLRELLPADLAPRIGELSPAQLVGLRFAGDDEVAALARRVLDENITTADEIKRLVRNWRPDYLRV